MTNEELVYKIKAGETDLMEQLWDKVYRFVAQQAGKYTFKYANRCSSEGLETDDFIQVGFFAMVKAIETFPSEDSQYKFTTYLHRQLLNHFNELSGNSRRYSMSEKQKSELNKVTDATSLDVQRDGGKDDYALSELIADPRAETELARIEESDYIEKLHEDLEAALKTLPPKQANSIRGYYLKEETLGRTAQALGISPGYVSALIHAGLLSLRKCTSLDSYRKDEYARAYKGGVKSFKSTGSSITEQIVINIDEQEQKLRDYLKMRLG
jgi:RNA polymerase sigma factor (sigma-70 family)